MTKTLQLPVIDLASPDRISTANSIRQACIECGFFYLINHGVEQELLKQVFDESKRFFSLPLEEKMKLLHRENRGYTPLYAENLNPSSSSKGELGLSDEEIFGASAHSDYGMITLLATDGVCRDKSKQPLVWEDVHHINGSTLHRVMSTGRERYSMAFFLNPSADCVVECLESCCSELTPSSHNGHNSRTCPNRGVKLFGVRLIDESIRKSASMGNLTHYTGSSSGNLQNGLAGNNHDSPGDTPDHGAAAGDGYASEDFCSRVVVHSGKKERKAYIPYKIDNHFREEMAKALQLPIIDLASPDRISIANSIRQACIECGFFYLINHGVEQELLKQVFDESKRFFSLPLEEKMKLLHRENRGYTPLYAENLNPSSSSKGDSKESFYIGPLDSISSHSNLNHWPSEEVLPSSRPTIESYYERVLTAGKKLFSLIALALNLDEDFFEKVGAFNPPMTAGKKLISLIALALNLDEDFFEKVCKDKSKQPLVWEDVHHINGSTLHRAPEFNTPQMKEEASSSSKCQSCPSSSMGNSEILQIMSLPNFMMTPNSINLDSTTMPLLDTIETDHHNKSSTQTPLQHSFIHLPFLPESHDAVLGLTLDKLLNLKMCHRSTLAHHSLNWMARGGTMEELIAPEFNTPQMKEEASSSSKYNVTTQFHDDPKLDQSRLNNHALT
ncbi:hypothetical protein HYC85_027618 [Camellia sinensis]|uniref:Non-haem dioxygenase N-terminal domain-containing protein n=1 Tax=Camellia sinensis TaxID=4442 RepID=A0A7J7G6X4_CAMSI|nr:hypothetical protein HYC85_027618 [Camellia sinensis]